MAIFLFFNFFIKHNKKFGFIYSILYAIKYEDRDKFLVKDRYNAIITFVIRNNLSGTWETIIVQNKNLNFGGSEAVPVSQKGYRDLYTQTRVFKIEKPWGIDNPGFSGD